MIKLMGLVCITTSTAPCTKATGATIFSMEKGRSLGLTGRFMKGSIWLARSMGWGFTAGTTAASTPENGLKIKLKGLELIAG